MSGHSKWSTIKRKKGAADARRSNEFAKLLRAVEVAAREGGSGDVKANMTLASAVDKASASSVPNDNIERAIKRGTGELDGGARYEEVTYEGYGPGGVAMFGETLTDNRNRTSQDVRHAFTRNGGNLGESGSTAWMFSRKGSIQIEKDSAPDEEALLDARALGGRHPRRRAGGGGGGDSDCHERRDHARSRAMKGRRHPSAAQNRMDAPTKGPVRLSLAKSSSLLTRRSKRR